MGRLTKVDKQVITGLGALLAVGLCAGMLTLGDNDSPTPVRTTDTAAEQARVLGQGGQPARTTPQAAIGEQAPTTPIATATAKPKPSAKPTPKPKPKPSAKPKPKPKPKKTKTKAPAEVYYANCTAVRAAGADPIYVGDPGYSRKLDRDGDGVGCE